MRDFPITGGSLTYDEVKTLSYRFAFHSQEPRFELLVAGRERMYLEYFCHANSPDADDPIPARVFEEYVRAYSRPGAFHNGSRYYQAWPQDELDNAASWPGP